MSKNWTRSETLALAFHECKLCNGIGMRMRRNGTIDACNCVLRGVFRVCFNHYRDCVGEERRMAHCELSAATGSGRPLNDRSFGRPIEEYLADFQLIAKRTLDEAEYRLFRWRFLLGGDVNLVCSRLGLTRGNAFHQIYLIEQKLGRVFAELEPYPLFPLDEYFQPCVRSRPGVSFVPAAA